MSLTQANMNQHESRKLSYSIVVQLGKYDNSLIGLNIRFSDQLESKEYIKINLNNIQMQWRFSKIIFVFQESIKFYISGENHMPKYSCKREHYENQKLFTLFFLQVFVALPWLSDILGVSKNQFKSSSCNTCHKN